MSVIMFSLLFSFFFFNDTATTEIYTLSLHDALPISHLAVRAGGPRRPGAADPGRHRRQGGQDGAGGRDRKSTRLNSSHLVISYAVFCLKKKKKTRTDGHTFASHSRSLHSVHAPPRNQ